jgi:hypothetical protein
MHNYKVWMQSEEYSEKLEFDLFFDELGDDNPDEQFIFVDLPTYQWRKDGYLDAAQAKQALRDLMQVGLNALAAEQEGPSRLALLVGGRAAADVAYERHLPRKIVGVGVVINGFEGVYGQRLWRSRWRWDTTFRFFRLQRSNYAAGLTPFTGELYLSTQATRIFSPTSYADIELGAGWALADTLAMSGPAPGQVALQTGPRTYAALVLLQRVYVAVNVDYYPWKVVDHPYYLTPNPVVDDWTWSIAGGWRFLY